MGQYYKPASLDAKGFVYSHDYGNGLKLMEHSWVSNNFVAVVENLLAEGSPWYKTRIVWAGDYGDEGLFLDGFENVKEPDEGEEVHHNVYSYASKYFEKMESKNDNHNKELKYVVNHTKKEYVDITKSPKVEMWEREWQIHPLPLLTCDGNGRGGGDYRGRNDEYVGVWAGDVISMERTIPEDCTEIQPDFEE